MNFKEVKKLVGDKVSTEKIKKIIKKISAADFKKEMSKKNGSIVELIKRKIKE